MFHSQSTQVELLFCGCLFLPDNSIILYCYFDADNFYYRNTGFVISLLFPVVSMLIDLSLLVQFRKNILKKIFVSMLSYIYNVKPVR